MAVGNMNLHLSLAIQQVFHTHDSASDLWATLKTMFGKQTLPSIYKDFKEAISPQFNSNSHCAAQSSKLTAAFGCLALVTVGTGADQLTLKVYDELQALIALSALPPKWETQISIITQNSDSFPIQCSM